MVSVVLPTYKRHAFLRAALQSVVAQDYDHFECIVVNDDPASVAEVDAVVAEQDDPRLRVVHHEVNKNLATSRNTGMSAARGELFAFLDDDDTWFPQYLSRHVRCHQQQPAAAVAYSGYLRKWVDDALPAKAIAAVPPPPQLSEQMLRGVFTIHSGSIVTMKADVFRTIGGFDPAIPNFEDWDLWYRLSLRYPFAYIPEPLIVYTQHLGDRESANVHKRLRGLENARNKYGHLSGFAEFYRRYKVFAYYGEIKRFALLGNQRGARQLLQECFSNNRMWQADRWKIGLKMAAFSLVGKPTFRVFKS